MISTRGKLMYSMICTQSQNETAILTPIFENP